jgi:photosystem II stability/assembly factor-like uncharacterized protein
MAGPRGTTLVESWPGTQWSVTPSLVSNSEFASVACAQPSSCMVVGKAGAASGANASAWQTLVEAWHGAR